MQRRALGARFGSPASPPTACAGAAPVAPRARSPSSIPSASAPIPCAPRAKNRRRVSSSAIDRATDDAAAAVAEIDAQQSPEGADVA